MPAPRQIIIDTETTGLNPATGDRLVEIAALEMVHRQLTDQKIHFYINPERDVPQEVVDIHGLTNEFLSDKPKFAEIADEFCRFVHGAELIIHNAPFDLSFIDHHLRELSLPSVVSISSGVIDTLVLSKKLFNGRGHSLDALCKRFRIDNSERTLHGALLDAELLADVYLEMTRGQGSLNFIEDTQQNDAILTTPIKKYWSVQIIAAAPEELAEHQRILAELDALNKSPCSWHKLQNSL